MDAFNVFRCAFFRYIVCFKSAGKLMNHFTWGFILKIIITIYVTFATHIATCILWISVGSIAQFFLYIWFNSSFDIIVWSIRRKPQKSWIVALKFCAYRVIFRVVCTIVLFFITKQHFQFVLVFRFLVLFSIFFISCIQFWNKHVMRALNSFCKTSIVNIKGVISVSHRGIHFWQKV